MISFSDAELVGLGDCVRLDAGGDDIADGGEQGAVFVGKSDGPLGEIVVPPGAFDLFSYFETQGIGFGADGGGFEGGGAAGGGTFAGERDFLRDSDHALNLAGGGLRHGAGGNGSHGVR